MDFEGAFFDTTNFELTTKKLGEGAFGKVYVVNSNKDGKQYAAKIINPNGMFNGKDQMMFLRESAILSKLNHPAIVKFFGINFHAFDEEVQLQPTILTEYLEHGSLKEILDKEKNSIADANWNPTKKYINLLGITDALRYLHSQGILHRDLKPQNILVDKDYYPRVCDFGLSRCFSKSIQLSMTGKIGTPLYMAPELLGDEDSYGPGIDVYAFSILAYEIVTGKEPYSTNGKPASLKVLLQKINSGNRPEFPDGVPEKMQELLNRCWSQEAKDRPSFEEIFNLLSEDFSYIDEDVEEDEIYEYLETLKEAREKEPKSKQDQEKNKDQKSTEAPEKPNSIQHNNVKLSDLLIDLDDLTVDSSIISKGAFGVTHKAILHRENQPDKECAAEYLNAGSIFTSQEQKKFFIEVECQSSLKHEAVLPLVGFSIPNGKTDNYTIISEFMPNFSLEQLIEKASIGDAPYYWEAIKSFNIFGIAAGMAYIHQHDVIHRDLKPEIIFLDENYHPKIGGFYYSKHFKQGTQNQIYQTLNIGTPIYMAPEVIEDSHYSNKIDVYSYAILLYELLSLKKAYSDIKNIRTFTLFNMVLEGTRPSIHGFDIPKQYVDLLGRCWHQDPNNRPSFIQIVKEFIDHTEDYFNMDLIEAESFFDYVDLVTKDLDFSEISNQ